MQRLPEGPVKFDLIWIDKSPMIKPYTIRRLRTAFPNCPIISVSEDDMYLKHNRSRYYEDCLPLFDVVFTTKPPNLDELRRLGARRTELFLDSFYEKLHRPLEDFASIEKKDIDVGFIGTYEVDRAASIIFLAEQGVTVSVSGSGWYKLRNIVPNLHIASEPVYGEDYVRTINRTKINLGFLIKLNRDQVTNRSIEIPACGAFLLGERTPRHNEMFKEGIEADFFSDNAELLNKIKYYFHHLSNYCMLSIWYDMQLILYIIIF